MKVDLEQIVPRRFSYLHIFLFGLAIRLVYLAQAWNRNEILGFPIVDAEVYTNWAHSILAGNLLWHVPSNYTPMYPYYLAFWFFLFGNATKTIFCAFLLLGAAQAVVIGRTAELLWNRTTGLVAALLAAVYWPFVVIEASFYAENLALWTLSLGLLLLCLHNKHGRRRHLLLAGFAMAVSCLCRANAILCLAAIACWLAWDTLRRRRGVLTAAGRLLLLLAPMILMSLPVMFWNYKLTKTPMLRTQGAECLYMGNEPGFGGLIVSPGWEWTRLEIEPLKEGKTLAPEKEEYWFRRTLDIVMTRPGEWLALQGKKLLMQLGNYEVSQEIDTYRFRNSSPLLGCSLWPGFGFVFPLALAGIILAVRRREALAVPVWLCAAAYLVSIFPFQVASRFRLLLVVPLLPFAAAFLVHAVGRIRGRQFQTLLAAGAGLLVGYAIVLPDHTNLAQRNTIDHWLFVGAKRLKGGDVEGAIRAFASSTEQLPERVDSLIQMGYAQLATNGIEQARASFQEARRRKPDCSEALLGLAGCAARSGQDNEAVELARQVLLQWPNSREALQLLRGVFHRQENWPMLELVLNQMRTYVNRPVDATFQLARLFSLQGNISGAVGLYEEIAGTGHAGSFDRSSALLLAGILKWRAGWDVEGARAKWNQAFEIGDRQTGPLAAFLLGRTAPGVLSSSYRQEDWNEAGIYLPYVLGIESWIRGDAATAAGFFQRVIALRHADKLKEHEMSILESWAMIDLARIGGGQTGKPQ